MTINPHRAQTLFLAALDIAEPTARRQLLDRECADDNALRQRVEALLAAHDSPDGFGEQSSVPQLAITIDEFASMIPGTLLAGRYKLLECIGEGGMGAVWVAEQIEPVRRKVAVKLVKAGMDSRQVLSRFEAERQALAVMDHPHIAKVFDGGVSDQGRPFFVMEYVKGVPITEFCDQARLSLDERLKLFVPVCQAVQHAHQKGIIHRDLKPSNILVCLYDGRPVPKVIDFGLAKAMYQSLTEHTLYTAHGVMVGTPLYMSPEQAEFNNLDIDTRTDIYSLGVILYELLTGSTPLEKRQLKEAAYNEVLRLIKEVEPPKPSTRLSGSASLPSIAAQRSIEPHQLHKSLAGDLDWIVMKTLDKERSRRYDTANDLARDIERYLNDEAVDACPPSTSYRLRKFIRKHRTMLVTTSAFVLLLVACAAMTTWQAIRATHAEETAQGALKSEARQRKIAEDKQREAEVERALALDALRAMTSEDVGLLISERTELTANERAYLEAIARRWEVFAHREGTSEAARNIRAEGAVRVGFLQDKLGLLAEAETNYRTAIAIATELADQTDDANEYRFNLGNYYRYFGLTLLKQGKRTEGVQQLRNSLEILERLAKEQPGLFDAQDNCAQTNDKLGLVHLFEGRFAESEQLLRRAVELRHSLVAKSDLPRYRHDLADSYSSLGMMFVVQGNLDAAEEQYQKALEIAKKLVSDVPDEVSYQLGLVSIHSQLGMILSVNGRDTRGAIEHLTQSRNIVERICVNFPSKPSYLLSLIGSHSDLAFQLCSLRRWTDARKECEKALNTLSQLTERFPNAQVNQISLSEIYRVLGEAALGEGKLAESLEWYDKAIQTCEKNDAVLPNDHGLQTILSVWYAERAHVLDRLGRYDEAIDDWTKAIDFSEPGHEGNARVGRAISKLRAGRFDEALADVQNVETSPGIEASALYNIACFYAVAGGRIVDKQPEYADRAMEYLRKAKQAGFRKSLEIADDADLNSLHERPDFQEFLRWLESDQSSVLETK